MAARLVQAGRGWLANMRDVLQAKDHGELDEQKLMCSRKVIAHFTAPYALPHGQGQGPAQGGRLVAESLPDCAGCCGRSSCPSRATARPAPGRRSSPKGAPRCRWPALRRRARAVRGTGRDAAARRRHAVAAAAHPVDRRRCVRRLSRAQAEVPRQGGPRDGRLPPLRRRLRLLRAKVHEVRGGGGDQGERAAARAGPAPRLPAGDALQEPFCRASASWPARPTRRGSPTRPTAASSRRSASCCRSGSTSTRSSRCRCTARTADAQGYRSDNTKVSGSTSREYSADPAPRYNNFHDRACVEWANAARLGPTKGHPNLQAMGGGRRDGRAHDHAHPGRRGATRATTAHTAGPRL